MEAPSINDLRACLDMVVGMEATIKMPEIQRLNIVRQ